MGMILNFEFWQSCKLDSEVLTPGKCFMKNYVDLSSLDKIFTTNIGLNIVQKIFCLPQISPENTFSKIKINTLIVLFQISPCTGWMQSNETIRDLTTKRAMELSAVLKDVAKNSTKYSSFKLYYAVNPINQG